MPLLLELFRDTYIRFEDKGYFQMSFGFTCVDAGFIPGTLGKNIGTFFLRKLRKANIYPINENCNSYSEEDVFDAIESLSDLIAKPIDGRYHEWNDCVWHYETFDQQAGREEYTADINEILADYKDGYELSNKGEILELAEQGLAPLMQANIPSNDQQNIVARINAATLKYRRYRSSLDDRRDAIRDLADVLEYLRPKVKRILTSKDEDDLFNIANNYAIRHHNKKQKTEYDTAIWYSWMFYFYLSTIHAVLRLIQREENKK